MEIFNLEFSQISVYTLCKDNRFGKKVPLKQIELLCILNIK